MLVYQRVNHYDKLIHNVSTETDQNRWGFHGERLQRRLLGHLRRMRLQFDRSVAWKCQFLNQEKLWLNGS